MAQVCTCVGTDRCRRTYMARHPALSDRLLLVTKDRATSTGRRSMPTERQRRFLRSRVPARLPSICSDYAQRAALLPRLVACSHGALAPSSATVSLVCQQRPLQERQPWKRHSEHAPELGADLQGKKEKKSEARARPRGDARRHWHAEAEPEKGDRDSREGKRRTDSVRANHSAGRRRTQTPRTDETLRRLAPWVGSPSATRYSPREQMSLLPAYTYPHVFPHT